MAKRQERTSGGDGYIYFLDCNTVFVFDKYTLMSKCMNLKKPDYINNLHTEEVMLHYK